MCVDFTKEKKNTLRFHVMFYFKTEFFYTNVQTFILPAVHLDLLNAPCSVVTAGEHDTTKTTLECFLKLKNLNEKQSEIKQITHRTVTKLEAGFAA